MCPPPLIRRPARSRRGVLRGARGLARCQRCKRRCTAALPDMKACAIVLAHLPAALGQTLATKNPVRLLALFSTWLAGALALASTPATRPMPPTSNACPAD